jgi:hypothetical protein
MSKKVAISAFVVASLSIFFTIGCSPKDEHLTRAKASAIIGASYPQDITGPCLMKKQDVSIGGEAPAYISADLAYFDYLKDHNILTYTTTKEEEPGTNGQGVITTFSATLTPQGQSLVTGPPSHSYFGSLVSNFIDVKQGQLTLSEITGIVEQGITAEVQYTEKESVTPFGAANCISVKPASKTATFTKYDDGWRLSK